MKVFLSITDNYALNFRVWIAWIRTILPLYPLMHGKFKTLCDDYKKKTIDDHLRNHGKPAPMFEKKVKAVFQNCPFLKQRGGLFDHIELFPRVTKYPHEKNFARTHFDYLCTNKVQIVALVRAKLDKLGTQLNGAIKPAEISEHFMKKWSSLTSKLNRPDDYSSQVQRLQRDKQNELFSRDTFRLRVLIVDKF
mmetsp:Transcript_16337/g.13420  ORF Transcript_16337/g.13420 Transcript_16337/m.13420 type:complete len:193 (+) Transcript_16337:1155-1733(+)